MHSLIDNLNSKHRPMCLNLTFEISHKESSKDKKKLIMFRLTFEGLADQIRIQHWPDRNFICSTGWILLNTPTKMTLTFWCFDVKVENLATSGKEKNALKTAELSKCMLYQHYKWCSPFIVSILCQTLIWFIYFKLYEMNEGSDQPREKPFDHKETVCYWKGAHLFDQKSTCKGFVFFLCNKVWTLLGLTAHRRRLKQNCMFPPPPTTPSISPKANEAQTGISRGDSHRMNP